ncbi:amidase domain-containing protein [Alicyclobacillus shizuokensis]|uniref:amidase domain-containing protein n=1 Tax=Alicyclobacillus shizuokensis TaxID=392014 RepID=UPI003570F2DD
MITRTRIVLSTVALASSFTGLVPFAAPAFAASYSRSAAASYADKYALSYNSSYPSYSDDCTNFASQSSACGRITRTSISQH